MSRRRLSVYAAAAVLFATALALPGKAQASRFSYLNDAAKEITAIDHSRTQLTQDDRGRIAKIACESLTKLINDPDFRPAMQSMSNPKFRQNRGPAHDLIMNVRDFNEHFVPIEEQNLRDLGYDAQSIKDTMDAAAQARTRANARKLTPAMVEKAIRDFQISVCQMAASSAKGEEIKDTSTNFLGVVLIVGDAAGELLTGAVGTAPVVASVAIGVGLIIGH